LHFILNEIIIRKFFKNKKKIIFRENFFFIRIIFEQNQADLEHATEELSGYLERDSNQTTNLTEIKQKVQDKYRYCATRRKVLLDHVTEGYECDYWSVSKKKIFFFFFIKKISFCYFREYIEDV
jgi:hypothetical protein